ncbi:MAG: cold shock domain-containing protein [Acidobacteriota bacterium]
MTSPHLDPAASNGGAQARHGVVKWYSVAKGYGFIAATDDDRDVFVHHSQLTAPDDLLEGDRVRFEMIEGPKGLQAHAVQVVD